MSIQRSVSRGLPLSSKRTALSVTATLYLCYVLANCGAASASRAATGVVWETALDDMFWNVRIGKLPPASAWEWGLDFSEANSSMAMACLGNPYGALNFREVVFPWSKANKVDASTIYKTSLRLNDTSGRPFEAYVLFAGNGAHMHGCDMDGNCRDVACEPGELAYIVGARLLHGYDDWMTIDFTPPGQLRQHAFEDFQADVISSVCNIYGEPVFKGYSYPGQSPQFNGANCAYVSDVRKEDLGAKLAIVCASGSYMVQMSESEWMTMGDCPSTNLMLTQFSNESAAAV